jgi:hypothetical protein
VALKGLLTVGPTGCKLRRVFCGEDVKRIALRSDQSCQHTGKSMEPYQSPRVFRMREIERQLTAELHSARERVRLAVSGEEKRIAKEDADRALQRFTDFAAKNIVPEEFR